MIIHQLSYKMHLTKQLPFDVCPLNLEYLIAKNKEIALTSNMMFVVFLFIMYFLYTNYSYKIKRIMNVLKRYVDLVEKMNSKNPVFDFENGDHDIYNPFKLHDYLNSITEESNSKSESDCEGGDGSNSDRDHNTHDSQIQVDSNNRRVLRSHTRKHDGEVEYIFDRDYNTNLVRNRKSKLGIHGKNWDLD